MKQNRIAVLLAAVVLPVLMFTGCGTIKAMFNGAHEVYVEGENAWNKDKNGSYALVKMARTMEIDPEYEAPKDFIIKNYKSIMANIDGKLSTLPKDNFSNLLERIDIYENLTDFHFFVAEGVVVNPVVIGDRVMMLETADYSADRAEAVKLITIEGLKEGKDLVKSGKFDESEKLFKTLTSRFLEGEEETAAQNEIAAAYAAKARELANSRDMKDIELGYKAVKKGLKYNGTLPELQSAETALDNRKGEILLADAKDLIKNRDAESLIKAWKIYQEVIKMFPDKAEYKNEAEALKTDIAEAQFSKASQMERSFDGKRDTYDKIIALYDAADSWVADYKGLRAKRDAFTKNAVIEIFVAVRHSDDNNKLQRALAKSVKDKLPKDRMFEIVSLNSPEGRELAAQVDMGSIPMGLAESYGFEYIIIADNFRPGTPQIKSSRSEDSETCNYISKNGRISEMSDSDKSAWSFSASLTGDNGNHLTLNSVSSELRSAMEGKMVDEIWFNVKNTEVIEKLWYEGRIDYSISFYDATSRRNWSQAQKIIATTSTKEGRTGFHSSTDSYRLAQYLSGKYPHASLEQPSMGNWDTTVLSYLEYEFKGSELASVIVSNIK